MYVLEQQIEREQFPDEIEKKYLDFIKEDLAPRYAEFIGKEIQTAYLEILLASTARTSSTATSPTPTLDPGPGVQRPRHRRSCSNRELLNQELEKIEKPAGIANPKDFRNEVVNFVLRARANNSGQNPSWTSYEKLREVIEKRMFSPRRGSAAGDQLQRQEGLRDEKKHEDFVNRMVERGYTERQVRRLVEWYMRVNKAG